VLTIQSFALPTQSGPVVPTRVDLGILPTSTPVPVTATLQPTVTPLPIPEPNIQGGGIPPVTSEAVQPTAVVLVTGAPPAPVDLGPAIASNDAFLVNPNTLQVTRPPDISPSTLYVDPAPNGWLAAVISQDAAHPGFGFSLFVGEESLVGSPLPSDTIRFTRVRWAPNSAAVAFVAETPGARGDGGGRIGDTVSDGLWVWTMAPGQPTQFTHHALQNRYPFMFGRDGAYMVQDFAWSPDSALLLVELDRGGAYPVTLGLINPQWNAGTEPIFIRHEFGSWSRDGSRILVSGEQTGVGPVLGWVNRDTRELTTLVDGRALSEPLWMRDAVELADGRIAMFGAPYDPADPGSGRNSGDVGLYIYNGGEPVLVAPIGGGPIASVEWNNARTAALVRMRSGRTFIVQAGGNYFEVSGTVGSSFVGWGE